MDTIQQAIEILAAAGYMIRRLTPRPVILAAAESPVEIQAPQRPSLAERFANWQDEPESAPRVGNAVAGDFYTEPQEALRGMRRRLIREAERARQFRIDFGGFQNRLSPRLRQTFTIHERRAAYEWAAFR